MKRFSIIFFGALAMLLASCSKEVVQNSDEEAWVHDLSLPVPVEFGAAGFEFETKADMITSANIADKRLKLFAVDIAQGSMNSTSNDNFLFAHEAAKVEGGRIAFEGGVVWYYPYASVYNYSFYAYYDGTGSTTRSGAAGESRVVDVDLKTNQCDILWASSHAKQYSGLDGFNARYIRKIKVDQKKGTYEPKMLLKHLTAAMVFKFRIETTGTNQDVAALGAVKVKDISVINVPTKGSMCVMHRDTTKEGTITNLNTIGSLTLDCSNIALGAVGQTQDVGTIFMFPTANKTVKAQLNVEVPVTTVNGVVEKKVVVPVELSLVTTSEDGFEAGKKYEYTVVMKSPEKIEIVANIADWETGDADIENTVSIIE